MTNQQSTWNAKIQTPEYTREFTITAVAVGTTSAHAFVTRDGSQVASDSIPSSVDQWYDRYTRSWVTTLRDQNGDEVEPTYDGTRADAAASKSRYEGMVK